METEEFSILVSIGALIVAGISAWAAIWSRIDSQKARDIAVESNNKADKSNEIAEESNKIAKEAKAEATRSADAAERSADAAEKSAHTSNRSADLQEAEFRERNIPKAIAKVYDVRFPKKMISNNEPVGRFQTTAQAPVYESKGIYGMCVRVIPSSIDFKVSELGYRFTSNGKLFEYSIPFLPPRIASIQSKDYPNDVLYFPKSLAPYFDKPYSLTIVIHTTSDITPVILSEVEPENTKSLSFRFKYFFEDCKSKSIELNDWYEKKYGEPVWQTLKS